MNKITYRHVACLLLLSGCQSTPPMPMHTMEHVNLQRFMGDWYVIANIPTPLEKGAYNAMESYRLDTDGTIATTFTFHAGAFDGPLKVYKPRGFVLDKQTNAIWGMRFIWPFKADYRIGYVAKDYGQTIIAREKRDYVWIMARTPTIPDKIYRDLLKRVEENGYDVSRIQKVPQAWK